MATSPHHARTARRILTLLLVFFTLSYSVPVIYASTDCDRWLTEYKQGLLLKRAARHLRAMQHRVKTKVTGIVAHNRIHLHHFAHAHKMSLMERLKRFELYCEPDAPPAVETDRGYELAELLPPLPMGPVPSNTDLVFSPTPMTPGVPPKTDSPGGLVGGGSPVYPPFGGMPPLGGVAPPISGVVPPTVGGLPPGGGGGVPPVVGPPVVGPPIVGPPIVGPPVAAVPEPSSLLLVATGVGAALTEVRRRRRLGGQGAVSL